jgi:hypothetical protein
MGDTFAPTVSEAGDGANAEGATIVTRRNVVLAAVALALGWRLVASLAGAACGIAGADPRGRTLAQRFAAIDEPLAARRHHSLGFSQEIFDAVADRVPEEGLLLFVCAPTPRNELLTMAVLDLLWPRRILTPERFAREQGAFTAQQRGRLFALTIADQKLDDPEPWERVCGDLRYVLWRAKEPAR